MDILNNDTDAAKVAEAVIAYCEGGGNYPKTNPTTLTLNDFMLDILDTLPSRLREDLCSRYEATLED